MLDQSPFEASWVTKTPPPGISQRHAPSVVHPEGTDVYDIPIVGLPQRLTSEISYLHVNQGQVVNSTVRVVCMRVGVCGNAVCHVWRVC